MRVVPGFAEVQRALAVAAHPDDLDFGCAATLALLADSGVEVHELVVTHGGSGSNEVGVDASALATIRVAEAQAAAAVVGAKLELLDYPDGAVELGPPLLRDLAQAVRAVRPDVVFAMRAEPIIGGTFLNHPDHRAVGQGVLDTCIAGAPTRLLFPELLDAGLEPWKPRTLLLYGPPHGDENFHVDVEATIARKAAALAAHASQVDGRDVEALVRDWAERRGEAAGMALAESFYRLEVFP